jgi:MauM/NapG family ferredoxin protein
MSRADFLVLLGSSLVLSACAPAKPPTALSVLRPPGALPENHFVDRCVRCGNCMKICPTNVLQPSMLESGLEGIWSPKMNFPASYCEGDCTLCGRVCPTGAIKSLTVPQKRLTKIGLAVVIRRLCVPWIKDTPCLVCEEHCPVPQKAIKIDYKLAANGKRIGRPVVDTKLCIGCGICENKCPVRPKRAIFTKPLQA